MLLDRLGCTGSEQTLLNCSHRGIGITSYYCGHDDDAGIRCLGWSSLVSIYHLSELIRIVYCSTATFVAQFLPDNCTEGNVRLSFGSTRNGTVEVCVNHTWGSICDSSWNSQDADVICRQLGFNNTLGISHQFYFAKSICLF